MRIVVVVADFCENRRTLISCLCILGGPNHLFDGDYSAVAVGVFSGCADLVFVVLTD